MPNPPAAFEASFVVASDHPALPGHFPGHPIVPGVVILGEVMQLLAHAAGPVACRAIPQAKFLSPLEPDEPCVVRFTPSAAGASFECAAGERLVARGMLYFDHIDEPA